MSSLSTVLMSVYFTAGMVLRCLILLAIFHFDCLADAEFIRDGFKMVTTLQHV